MATEFIVPIQFTQTWEWRVEAADEREAAAMVNDPEVRKTLAPPVRVLDHDDGWAGVWDVRKPGDPVVTDD